MRPRDKMVTRDNQIKRVVKILSEKFKGDHIDWEKYYALIIYPIENDINEFETDAKIRHVLGEIPYNG